MIDFRYSPLKCQSIELMQIDHSLRRALSGFIIGACFALTSCSFGSSNDTKRNDHAATIAPSGKLKIGYYLGSPTSMVKDAKTGESRGLTVELGQQLANRLGVETEFKEYPRLADVVEALKAGEVDFTVTNASPARALIVDFSPTVVSLELGYLVMPNSKVSSPADVDRTGIVIGVSQGSSSQATLSRELKLARLEAAPTLKLAGEWLVQGKIDAFATNKAILFELSSTVPNSRVLDGRWGLEHLAIGIPKKRDAAHGFVNKFVEEMQQSGFVKDAASRAGMRGIAP
jgi:polar amino acid transport system substrate-binding protein